MGATYRTDPGFAIAQSLLRKKKQPKRQTRGTIPKTYWPRNLRWIPQIAATGAIVCGILGASGVPLSSDLIALGQSPWRAKAKGISIDGLIKNYGGRMEIRNRFLPQSIMLFLSATISLSLLVAPVVATAASPGEVSHAAKDAGTGCADGERRAKSDISGGTWFAIGCLAGLIGYLIALSEPNPPAMQLLGKPPEYVAAYTDCYREKGKNIKSKNALTGCLVGTGISIVFYAVLIAAANDNTTY